MRVRVLAGVAATLILATAVFVRFRTSRRLAPGPLAIAAASAAVTRVPDGCDLVPKADIEAILAQPLFPPRLRVGICEYRLATDGGERLDTPVVGVRLYRAITKPAFEAETERSATLLRLPLEPIAGLGEEAIKTGDAEVSVYARGAAVSVMRGDSSIDDAKAREIAERAVTRLR